MKLATHIAVWFRLVETAPPAQGRHGRDQYVRCEFHSQGGDTPSLLPQLFHPHTRLGSNHQTTAISVFKS